MGWVRGGMHGLDIGADLCCSDLERSPQAGIEIPIELALGARGAQNFADTYTDPIRSTDFEPIQR